MPMYVYQVVNDDGTAGEVFEVLQGLSEPELTAHPETGRPVRKLIGLPSVSAGSGGRAKPDLSDKNLDRLGFTKYKNAGGGRFEKTAGQGPGVIQRDS